MMDSWAWCPRRKRTRLDIAPIGSNTEKLNELRPVTFRLKTDPQGPIQYGLIAEEVANVYPELVIRDGHGEIDGVRYEELLPMLLNELQNQQFIVQALSAQNATQAAEIRSLKQLQGQYATETELTDLKQQLQAALSKLQAEAELLAQRRYNLRARAARNACRALRTCASLT